MPVLTKKKHRELVNILDERIASLYDAIRSRELKSNSEGCKRRFSYQHPEVMCATVGQDYEIRLAVEDFKNILAEIKKLK